MDQRAAPAAPRGKAFRQHADDRRKILLRQRPVGPRTPEAREQSVLVPALRRYFGDDLLRQHVERRFGHAERIELAAPYAVQQRRAFHQVVARERKQPPLGRAIDGVAGAADPLQERCDRARRADLAHEIDLSDVDAEFERGGGDQRLQFPALEPLLGVEPLLLGEAAVMCGHRLLPEEFGQGPRDPLRQPPCIDEDQGGVVLLNQCGEAFVELRQHLVRHHRFQRRVGNFNREVARALVTDVDDLASGNRRSGVRVRSRVMTDRTILSDVMPRESGGPSSHRRL